MIFSRSQVFEISSTGSLSNHAARDQQPKTSNLHPVNYNPMNICYAFSSKTVADCGDIPASQRISLTFSEAARLSAEDALPVKSEDSLSNKSQPFNFVIPAMQVFGSISRIIE
jgi:hypothetical protein